MQFAPECVPCLLHRVLYEVKLVSPGAVEEAMAESLRILSLNYPKGMNSAKLATMVHERAYAVSGSKDPYCDLKIRSDEVAKSLLPQAESLVREAEDPLEMAVKVAIAGNVLDFGIDVGMEHPEELRSRFDKLVHQDLGINHLPKAKRLLRPGMEIAYLLDNCGESVLDSILINELKAQGARVFGVVKGEPILTDVTMEDALRIGLDKCLDEILSTRSFAVGIDLDKIPHELMARLEDSDLIVSKGMANLESLSDENLGPILYLLRVKCDPVARLLGAKRNWNIAKLCE
ncbi:MAG: ARMT1-like domain-containing protein [Methanomassiliicoccales archaeon]